MATGWFGPCPHCKAPLAYLESVSGSVTSPKCPRCSQTVVVTRATLLMADNSGPSPTPTRKPAKPN